MRILIIQGHPDPVADRFDVAIAEAYARGARAGGHEVRQLGVAALDFPVLRRRADWEGGEPPADIRRAQEDLLWAEHLVLVFPLWLGDVPALFKGFLEQVLRPAFTRPGGGATALALRGRSARVVVTMGMPALMYRLWYRAHAVKSLQRNVLAFCGVRPVRASFFGLVEMNARDRRGRFLRDMERLGRKGR